MGGEEGRGGWGRGERGRRERGGGGERKGGEGVEVLEINGAHYIDYSGPHKETHYPLLV